MQGRKIRVSVVMPCFNDGEYLAEAIESVDLKHNPDTEIMVIDDGSTDAQTLQVLEQLKKEGIRVLHTAHEGPSGARNAGIREAAGEYILPLDADDRIESQYIAKAVQTLDGNPEIGVVYCRADLFGEESGPWKLPDYSFDEMLVRNLVFVTAMFRKEDWTKLGGFSTDMEDGLEDYDFFIGILSLGKQIVQLPEVLFHYRIKKKSRTTQFMDDPEKVKRAFSTIYRRHEAFYHQHATEYACLLRNELIQTQFEKQKILESSKFLLAVKKIPLVSGMARMIWRKK